MSLSGRYPLSGGRVSRGDHKSGTWPVKGSKSMSLYRRSTLTREQGCSICVWPEGHKLMSLCAKCPLVEAVLVEVTIVVHGQKREANQCPYIGGQHLPENMGVVFVCGQRP